MQCGVCSCEVPSQHCVSKCQECADTIGCVNPEQILPPIKGGMGERILAMRCNRVLLSSVWVITFCSLCGVGVAARARQFDSGDANAALENELIALTSAVAPRAVYQEITPVYIDCFDDSSEWTGLDGLTIEDVSEYGGEKAYLCGDKYFSAILMTKLPASGSYNYSHMMKEFSQPRDFFECSIACRLKMPEGDGPSDISNIYKVVLRFIDESGIVADCTLSAGTGPGWKEAIVPQAEFEGGSGEIDWSKIARIAIVLFTKANATPHVILDRLMLFKDTVEVTPPTTPIVINTFDDGLRSQYDAAAYLSGKGMTGTFYIIGRPIDEEWPTCLTLNSLMDMKYAGHLIANHTWEHLMPFDGLTLEEQTEQITTMYRWMCLHGFGDGARILGTPANAWNPQMNTYLSPYYDHVRQVLSGGGLYRNPLYDKRHSRVTATNPMEAMTQVQKAIEDKNCSVVVYMGHDMSNEAFEEFKVYADYLYEEMQARQIRVCSPAGLLRL
jgi:peptidoglycan/xylan/chitin deacetylase (PgdA/CDA1 family)